jgi:hypothetical protein
MSGWCHETARLPAPGSHNACAIIPYRDGRDPERRHQFRPLPDSQKRARLAAISWDRHARTSATAILALRLPGLCSARTVLRGICLGNMVARFASIVEQVLREPRASPVYRINFAAEVAKVAHPDIFTVAVIA